jgi:hypothetical protein
MAMIIVLIIFVALVHTISGTVDVAGPKREAG